MQRKEEEAEKEEDRKEEERLEKIRIEEEKKQRRKEKEKERKVAQIIRYLTNRHYNHESSCLLSFLSYSVLHLLSESDTFVGT